MKRILASIIFLLWASLLFGADVFYSARPAGAGSGHDMSTRSISFTSGGTYEIEVGNTITGATSTETAVVAEVTVSSGSWAGGDAAGTLTCFDVSGTFQSENLDVGANSNVATISGDFGSRGTIVISSGTATFSVAQKGDIGVGCYVSSSNVSGYIKEMTDSTHAKIITATGGTHADVSSETLGAIYHPYASLSAAEAGATDANHLNTTNLVAGTINLKIPCYGATADNPSQGIIFDGIYQSEDYYVTIYTPRGGTESINNWRHQGVWSESYFRIEQLSSYTPIQMRDNYYVFDGLQISVSADSHIYYSTSYYNTEGAALTVKNCILKSTSETATNKYALYLSSSYALTYNIENCIIYGFNQSSGCGGIYIGADPHTVNIYNCTICNNYYGINQSEGTITTKNSAVFNNTDDINGTVSLTYCAGDDSDFSSGTGNIQWTSGATDWANVFTDYSNGDFSLKNYTSTGALINAGTTISGMTAVDIIGTARPQGAAWDIGAIEYGSGSSPAVSGNGVGGSGVCY